MTMGPSPEYLRIELELADEALSDMLQFYDFAVDDTDLDDAWNADIGPQQAPGFPEFIVYP